MFRKTCEEDKMSHELEIIEHHLRLFGWKEISSCHMLRGKDKPTWSHVDDLLYDGGLVVIVLPEASFLEEGGIDFKFESSVSLKWKDKVSWGDFITLHESIVMEHVAANNLLLNENGSAVWIQFDILCGKLILLGTDIANDLIRFRQGDPQAVFENNAPQVWGFDFERPLHLYEEQLKGVKLHERPADVWGMALATAISNASGIPLLPILPKNAIGAVVITGDDDQAYLEKYQEQLDLLDGLPITYFLHPETRHTKETIKNMLGATNIDLAIHPDALDSPSEYESLLIKQSIWFKGLTGHLAKSVRNHGFLSDGYWKHVYAWCKAGISFSSNVPGLNGRVLNGSLLPARIALNNSLTKHWSILTAVGDGVVFALNMGPEESAEVIFSLADAIRASNIPGIIVVNLHPQNIEETRSMHLAIKELVNNDFIAWNMEQCYEWFDSRDKTTVSGIFRH